MKSYYQILGVAENATAEEIKKVFRKLARENHPDTHPGDTARELRFKEVATAYETLGDAEKRKKYDTERSKQNFGNRTKKRSDPKNPFDLGVDFNDMFDDIFEKPASKDSTQQTQNPLNVDNIFSKFMGFKP